ncbi:hypothetical protein HanPI659440_Chr15g0593311 [Helianthus annuus]|nr:hypothetical protein HanPI659440_Chr15g0593311 [Helianthus annuus]
MQELVGIIIIVRITLDCVTQTVQMNFGLCFNFKRVKCCFGAVSLLFPGRHQGCVSKRHG